MGLDSRYARDEEEAARALLKESKRLEQRKKDNDRKRVERGGEPGRQQPSLPKLNLPPYVDDEDDM